MWELFLVQKKDKQINHFFIRKPLILVFFLLYQYEIFSRAVLLSVLKTYLFTGVFVISKHFFVEYNSYDYQNLHGTYMCHWHYEQVKVLAHICATGSRRINYHNIFNKDILEGMFGQILCNWTNM